MINNCSQQPSVQDGKCPACGRVASQIAFSLNSPRTDLVQDIAPHPKPQRVDWEGWSLCDSCSKRWQVGEGCNPPGDPTAKLTAAQIAYQPVVPRHPAPGTAAEFFASRLWAREQSRDPNQLGPEECIRLFRESQARRS